MTTQRREVGAPLCNIDFEGNYECNEGFSFINLGMNKEEAAEYFATTPYKEKQIIRLRIPLPNGLFNTFCFDVLELYKWISENPNANLDAGYVCKLSDAQKRQIVEKAEALLPATEKLTQQNRFAWERLEDFDFASFAPPPAAIQESTLFDVLQLNGSLYTQRGQTACVNRLLSNDLNQQQISWTSTFGGSNFPILKWQLNIHQATVNMPRMFGVTLELPFVFLNITHSFPEIIPSSGMSQILQQISNVIRPYLSVNPKQHLRKQWDFLRRPTHPELNEFPFAELIDPQTITLFFSNPANICTLWRMQHVHRIAI